MVNKELKNFFDLINKLKEKTKNEANKTNSFAEIFNLMENSEDYSDLESMANQIAKELSDKFNIDNVGVVVNTPNNNINVSFNKKDNEKLTDKKENRDNLNPKQTECKCKTTTNNNTLLDDGSCICDCYKPRNIAVLNLGNNDIFFYNAVYNIYKERFSLGDFIYNTFSVDLPDFNQLDKIVILPNIWGKILNYELDALKELLNENIELFVINPETFDVERVTFEQLDGMRMTKLQEEISCK